MKKIISALRRRKKLALILAGVLAIVVGPYLVSRVRSPHRRVRLRSSDAASAETASAETKSLTAESTLRIATYNIAHGRGATDDNWEEGGDAKQARIEKIARLLKDSGADVVVLNEVDFSSTWSGHRNQAAAIAALAGFPHWVEQRNIDFRFIYGSWKFGNAVLSKFPIVATELVDFPALKSWEDWLAGHKRGVVATLRINPKRKIRVLAVHLEYRSEDLRVACAREINELEKSSAIPLIAAGDFNSTPPGLPQSQETGDGENAMSVVAASGRFGALPTSEAKPAALTYSATTPERAIDWILIPKDWEYVEHRVIDSQLSDHRPVVATIRFR